MMPVDEKSGSLWPKENGSHIIDEKLMAAILHLCNVLRNDFKCLVWRKLVNTLQHKITDQQHTRTSWIQFNKIRNNLVSFWWNHHVKAGFPHTHTHTFNGKTLAQKWSKNFSYRDIQC
jgi:hypothetical protein